MTDRELLEQCLEIFERNNDCGQFQRWVDKLTDHLAQPEQGGPCLDPTPEMIEAGAQRLVRWESGEERWPASWDSLHIAAARNDAERVWRSMWLAAAPRGKGE